METTDFSDSNSGVKVNNDFKIKCDSCDIEAIFKNEKEAFLDGWAFRKICDGLVINYCPICDKESL